jgi:transmembrane sensor
VKKLMGKMRTSSREIDWQAGEWAVKRASGALTPGEEAAFETWLAADVRHPGAYLRAEAVMARLERVAVVGGEGLRPKSIARPAMRSSSNPFWTRRRMVLTGSLAASFAAIGVVGSTFWKGTRVQEFVTKVGEVRVVPLSDGSLVTLNTNTRLSVRYTATARNIDLVQGEALFDVAKDKQRPFTVSSGDTQVVAVGTSFTVRALPQRPIQVLVREGIVEVKRAGAVRTIAQRAVANTRTVVAVDAPIITREVPPETLARNLAWEAGLIAFDNEPLGKAAEEFERYSTTRIVVDPDVADRAVTGIYASNNPVGFAKVTAKVLNLHMEVSAEEVRISH